jgi:hypothetical protein
VVNVNRGPYVLSAPATAKFKVDRQSVPIPGEGTWYVPVPAGPHDVRYTDFLGFPVMTTTATVHPGTAHPLSFRFGGWRNRVYDGSGADVTRFGMWSNYLIMLITFGLLALVCVGCVLLVALTGN